MVNTEVFALDGFRRYNTQKGRFGLLKVSFWTPFSLSLATLGPLWHLLGSKVTAQRRYREVFANTSKNNEKHTLKKEGSAAPGRSSGNLVKALILRKA